MHPIMIKFKTIVDRLKIKNIIPFLKELRFNDRSPLIKVGIVTLGLIVGFGVVLGVGSLTKLIMHSACTVIMSDETKERLRKRSKPVLIEAVKVTPGTISKRIQTVGKLRPNNMIVLKAEIHGRIREIPVREGSEVKKGDVIIQFDDADAKAELQEATATLELREADLGRMNALKHVEAMKKVDEARAARDVALARVEKAKATLDKTQIKAAFSGTMGLIEQSPGAYVQAGQEIGALVENNPMKVDFKIPEQHFNDIGLGQAILIKLDGFKDQEFHATVEAIDSRVDQQSHSVAVRGTLPNPKGLLKGGLFANTYLIIGEKGDALLVPESSVDRDGDDEFVWVVKRNKASRRKVLTGSREKGKIEIISGINPGDIVVSVGYMRFRGDGQPVRITNLNDDGTEKTKEEQEKIRKEDEENTSDA